MLQAENPLHAEVDDIIVGVASNRLPNPGHLIYASRVKEILPFQDYWLDSRFANRKPIPATPICRSGDNIWHRNAKGVWAVAPNDFHDERHRERDISGANVLIATEFYYLGQSAIRLPSRFSLLLAKTHCHKNTSDLNKIAGFWRWIGKTAPKLDRIDYPSEFDEDMSRAQCGEVEGDDIEELWEAVNQTGVRCSVENLATWS